MRVRQQSRTETYHKKTKPTERKCPLRWVRAVLQTRTAACVGAATCWTSPWPCTASSSLPATFWTSSSLYILWRRDDKIPSLGEFCKNPKKTTKKCERTTTTTKRRVWICCVPLSCGCQQQQAVELQPTAPTIQPLAVSGTAFFIFFIFKCLSLCLVTAIQ